MMMRDVQNLHRHWKINREDAVCAEFHIKVEINIAARPRRTKKKRGKKYLKNTISRIFMELFLGISHWLRGSQRSCLPFCVLTRRELYRRRKTINFSVSSIHKLRDKFKPFPDGISRWDKRHRDDQTLKKNSQKNWSEKRKIK